MKSTIHCLLYLLLCFLMGCTGIRNTGHNPYNLDIVTDLDVYRKQVWANPENALADIQQAIPDVVLDIRYATKDNFTGRVIYRMPKAFARLRVVEALKLVQDSLSKFGLGLKIYDAYRPYAATLYFYKVYSDTNFVANPRHGSRHNRGCAVDVSLVALNTRLEVKMPTLFDVFSERANQAFMDLDPESIKNRELLEGVMTHFGFDIYPDEWWHYDFRGWEKYPLMDIPFEKLISVGTGTRKN